MNRLKFDDSRNLLRFACDDLEALRFVVQAVEDQKDWPYDREMLKVVLRSLDPIITDIQVCLDSISEELKEE